MIVVDAPLLLLLPTCAVNVPSEMTHAQNHTPTYACRIKREALDGAAGGVIETNEAPANVHLRKKKALHESTIND